MDKMSLVAEEPLLAYSFYRLVSCSSVEEVHVLLRGMSQESLRKIPQWVLKYLGKDVAQKFLQGALMEATMYYVVSELTSDPINKEDFVFDVLIAGLRNVLPFSKRDQMILACIQGIDVENIYELVFVESIEKFKNEFLFTLSEIGSECIISMVFEYYLNSPYSKLYTTLQRSSSSKIGSFLYKLGLKNPKEIIKIYSKSGKHNQKWLDDILKTVSKPEGEKAFIMLQQIGFNLDKISAKNFERLSQIIKRYGESENLKRLLKNGLDINRMIIYIEKTGSTLEQFVNSLERIKNNNMFSNTITIKCKIISLLEFTNNYSDDLVTYYYRQDGNKCFLLKYHNDIQLGIEIVVDYASKILLDGSSRIITALSDEKWEKLKTDEK